MSALVIALQFVSVAFPAVMGVLWLVTNFLAAWSPKSNRDDAGLFLNAGVGVLFLGVAVFLAALYGWVG